MEEKILFWSTLCYTFLLSGTMIGFGFLFQKRPPKNINGLYGYRTAMSMKNQATWTFAHHYAGKIWFYSGIASLSLSLVVLFLFCRTSCFETVSTILMFAQLILLVGVILPTERLCAEILILWGIWKKKTKAKEKSKPGNHTGFWFLSYQDGL